MNSQSKAWGLYRKDSTNAVPLKHLNVSIKIFHSIARVIYSQEYYNDADSLIETEFFFPISPDACFDSFEATFNNITIKGVVKEKEKAKEEYKQAIEEGRTAAYSEINKETGDIMKVQIGNIPPKTNIAVTYSYVQKLETSLNKFWCFRLFSTLTPRYNNMSNLQDFLNHDVGLLSSYPTVSKNSSQAYPWSIEAEVHSPSPITCLRSPSHEITTTYGNENHTCNIALKPDTKHFPNKDFVLMFSNGKEDKLDYLLTPFEDGYCAMVSLLADFEKNSSEEAFNNFAKAKETENPHSMDTIRGEYIFLIDRSGSMGGDRITMARNSLILFLKSLPKDSFFNVVSFGTSFDFLYPESLENSQESIDSAEQRIRSFEADMGGTEIYNALAKIFKTPPKKGYPRFVFLLTDGAVSNTQKVLDLIAANSDKTRTFTIGIGNGCSPELINKGAAYGRGKAEFVTDNNQTFEKVISLLNASLSPCFSDLSLQADNFDAIVKSVSPNPASLPFLINGQTITFFLFLRSEAFGDSQKMYLQLHMRDSRKQKPHVIDITLNASEAFENEMIPKLAIHDMIKRLEVEKDQASGNKDKEIVWMGKEDLEQAMTEYSLKYGILCKETAFFCEIADNETNSKNILPTKIVVPTTLSQDYESRAPGSFAFWSAPKSNSFTSSVKSMATPPSQERFRTLQSDRSGMVGCAPPAGAMKLSTASNKSSSGNVFSSIAGGVSNAFDSLFSSKKKSKSKAAPPTNSIRDKSYVPSNTMDTFARKSSLTECEEIEESFAPAPQTENLYQAKTYAPSRKMEAMPQSLKFDSYAAPPTSTTQNKGGSSYLDVIMKQKYEGYWDPNDQTLKNSVVKDSKLSQAPAELQVADATLLQAVWMTILVLRWLEVVCKDDRKAWLLIYQKGCEWLKGQGVDFEAVKELGSKNIKV